MARNQVYYEDVAEGDEIKLLEKGPIEHGQITEYADASGDRNPIHMDNDAAKKAGLKNGVIAHGMLSMAFLGQLMTDWIGDGDLKKLGVNFRGMVKPGDVLTCDGKILKKYRDGDEGLVECELTVTNQNGDKLTRGEATASLPKKDN